MPARIDEKTQFQDSAGIPIVNGLIFIGLQNSDPVSNPIVIFSDRALTIPIANPQATDSNGRAVNKIWIPGDYSIRVNDSLGAQQMIDLDAGITTEASGVTPLTNAAGTDTITAEGTPTVLAYANNEMYVFQAVNNNTGPVTLNIDGVGPKPIVNNVVDPLVANDIIANGAIVVVFNDILDAFEWVNQNVTNLENNLLNSLQPTGLAQFYVGLTAPAGWILADGGSIGNAASGGTNRANADTEALFTLFWNSMADAQAPVSGGRGGGAAADFALNKNLTIPDMRGRAPFGTGGVKPAVHGVQGGLEGVTLTIPEIPAHDHDYGQNQSAPRSGGGVNGGSFIATLTTTSTGGDGEHENMPPFTALSFVYRL